MGIEIILYDSSPITQKIFFHILYPYRPTVHRIDQTSKLIEKVQYSIPDIIFIDAAFSDDIKNQINKKKEQLKNVPIILMAKEDLNHEELKTSVAQDFLKKPIEAGKLRELVNRFIPRTKSNVLTEHLKFPPIPDFKEEKNTKQGSEFSPKTTVKQPEFKQNDSSSDDIVKKQATNETIQPITATQTSDQQETAPPVKEPNQTPNIFPTEEGIKPITATQTSEQQETDSPVKEPNQTPNIFPTEEGIKPITATQTSDQQETAPPVKEPNQTPNIFPTEEGIKPITATQTSDQQETAPPVKEPNQTPNIFPTEEGIKPITATQTSDQQENDPPLKQEKDTSHDEGKKSVTDVKILQVPSESEPTNKKEDKLEEPNLNTHLKDQITEEIKLWANRKIKGEVKKQLEHLIKENSQNTIQTITEKAVWQVVPELAKQLITKELDKLLKEEENQTDEDE